MPVLRLLFALILLAGPVLADTNADVRAHFKKGQMHYALGEFPEAIGEFREAYRLKQEPAILFNLAQTYRQLHEWQHAYFHYRQYLIAKPNAPNRAEVEDFIEQMKNRMDEEDRAARADFNQRVDGAPQHAPPVVAQTAPVAVASQPAPAAVAPERAPVAVASQPAPAAVAPERAPAAVAPQPFAAAVAPERAPAVTPSPSAVESPPSVASNSSASNDAPSDVARPASTAPSSHSAAVTDPAAVAAATRAPPVVLTPQPVPAAGAPPSKPEFVDSSPGPLVVEKHASAWRYTGYAMIGVGLVAGGVAYAMHSSAQSSADQFNSKYQANALTPADTKLRDESESKGRLATEALIAGIGLVAAGGALTIAF
jgi:hypothetical protein